MGAASANKNGSPSLGAAAGTFKQAYPDLAHLLNCGDGSGLVLINDIIHDFISYNDHVLPSLGNQIREALSTEAFALLEHIAGEAESRGLALFLVGGFPRDLVLGREPVDFDLVVEGDAIGLARALAARHGGQAVAHSKFGTTKWHLKRAVALLAGERPEPSNGMLLTSHVDLISARREEYARPAALPRVELGTIDDDLARRDFTINTLAIRIDGGHFGEILDQFGALGDLDMGIVRVLSSESFNDDPTRMYRAVRYEKRYGFRMARGTVRLVPEARKWVSRLSAHRIRRELDLILGEEQASPMIRRLGGLDLLKPIHGALPTDAPVLRRLGSIGRPPDGQTSFKSPSGLGWHLWLMGLSAAQLRSIVKRLHFDKALTVSLLAATELRTKVPKMASWRPSRSTAYLEKKPLRAVEAVYRSVSVDVQREVLGKYLRLWRHVRPTVTGSELKRLGVPAGPAYQIILGALRKAWLDGEVGSPAEERELLEAMLGKLRQAGGQT